MLRRIVLYSTQPGFVIAYVPFGLPEEVAAALRAAEPDSDVAGRNAITEKLTIPLNDWPPRVRRGRRGDRRALTHRGR